MGLKTGRILATAVSTPSYDPNQLASHDASQAGSNYGVLSRTPTPSDAQPSHFAAYPPGPIKAVVAAAL